MTSQHDNEEWRPMPDYEHLYEVSSFGRVRKTKTNKNGPFKAGYILKPKRMKSGHLFYNPSDGFGNQGTQLAHRLVARAFLGEPLPGYECCHNDGNPENNHLNNLRWDTRKNNIADAKKHGTHNKGSVNGQAKLTEEDVIQIRRLRQQGALLSELASDFGVKQMAISSIVNRKTWKHVP